MTTAPVDEAARAAMMNGSVIMTVMNGKVTRDGED